MILDEIVEHKKKEVEELKKKVPLADIKKNLGVGPCSRSFKEAVSKPGRVNIIAEIKKQSPSKGIIRGDFDPVGIAEIYEAGNADAVSVLTDSRYFGGSAKWLSEISKSVGIPVLRKEFIIDEYQVYEAKRLGADAVLLIAAILEQETIARFIDIASELGMDCLTEAHTEGELEKAVSAGADIIGINNRNLKDFSVDTQTTIKLKRKIPAGKVVVSESGISSAGDMKLMKEHGINAVLIGESLLKEDDIAGKLKELKEFQA